jgi:hypothetical protein
MYASDDWNAMFDAGLGSTHKVVPLAQGTEAKVVEVRNRPKDGYYDEYLQGDDEIYVIFQVGDRFFKKTGTLSSYDEIRTWDGPVTEVFGTTKQVTVFVPKGGR